jgi:heterogeneous nuclear ribonucleoprotein A1/A3
MEGKDGNEGKTRKLEESNTPEIAEEVAAKLLVPFSKEQLADILNPTIINHSELLDKVRQISNQDISLRKLFVRGLGYETKKVIQISLCPAWRSRICSSRR